MITIDGSFGEGGGQILRTALGLSMVTQSPFMINNIRARRKRPGLLRQHLTAVQAAAQISCATVEGDFLGSQQLLFKPKRIKTGDYSFAVGTAGSATLVLQAILPPLLIADNPCKLTLSGGTHNPYAPPFDFLNKAFIPIINRMGAKIEASIRRYGFYPAGGGEIKINISPTSKLSSLNITERGELLKKQACALFAKIPQEIADDEIKLLGQKIGLTKHESKILEVSSPGPGNVVLIEYRYEKITEVFTGFGEPRKSRYKVVKQATDQLQNFLKTKTPVGKYLADQLLIPFAMAGRGEFYTSKLTKHAITNIEIIRKFLEKKISVNQKTQDIVSIAVGD